MFRSDTHTSACVRIPWRAHAKSGGWALSPEFLIHRSALRVCISRSCQDAADSPGRGLHVEGQGLESILLSWQEWQLTGVGRRQVPGPGPSLVYQSPDRGWPRRQPLLFARQVAGTRWAYFSSMTTNLSRSESFRHQVSSEMPHAE